MQLIIINIETTIFVIGSQSFSAGKKALISMYPKIFIDCYGGNQNLEDRKGNHKTTFIYWFVDLI